MSGRVCAQPAYQACSIIYGLEQLNEACMGACSECILSPSFLYAVWMMRYWDFILTTSLPCKCRQIESLIYTSSLIPICSSQEKCNIIQSNIVYAVTHRLTNAMPAVILFCLSKSMLDILLRIKLPSNWRGQNPKLSIINWPHL